MDDAFEDAASGDAGYGQHHFSLVCYANNQEQLNHQVGELIALFSDRAFASFLSKRSDLLFPNFLIVVSILYPG